VRAGLGEREDGKGKRRNKEGTGKGSEEEVLPPPAPEEQDEGERENGELREGENGEERPFLSVGLIGALLTPSSPFLFRQPSPSCRSAERRKILPPQCTAEQKGRSSLSYTGQNEDAPVRILSFSISPFSRSARPLLYHLQNYLLEPTSPSRRLPRTRLSLVCRLRTSSSRRHPPNSERRAGRALHRAAFAAREGPSSPTPGRGR
jgi:hypothetical protein